MKQVKLTLSERNADEFKTLACRLDVTYDTLVGWMIEEFKGGLIYDSFLRTMYFGDDECEV